MKIDAIWTILEKEIRQQELEEIKRGFFEKRSIAEALIRAKQHLDMAQIAFMEGERHSLIYFRKAAADLIRAMIEYGVPEVKN